VRCGTVYCAVQCAARCGSVRCGAVRCGTVYCCEVKCVCLSVCVEWKLSGSVGRDLTVVRMYRHEASRRGLWLCSVSIEHCLWSRCILRPCLNLLDLTVSDTIVFRECSVDKSL
jgi:hypothetical protein